MEKVEEAEEAEGTEVKMEGRGMKREKWVVNPRPHQRYKSISFIGFPLKVAILLTITQISEATFGSWTEQCKQGGQCSSLMKSYEILVMGTECRSFYVTGECSRLCTYSLRALISRKMWNRCARMCEWGEAIVSGAEGWLALCQERPVQNIQHGSEESGAHDENKQTEVHGISGLKGGDLSKVKDDNIFGRRLIDKSGSKKGWLRAGRVYVLTKLLLAGVILLTLLTVVSLAPNSVLGAVIRTYIDIPRWINGVNAKGQRKLPERVTPSKSFSRLGSSGRVPGYTRADSRAQRGARRHLVGAVLFT